MPLINAPLWISLLLGLNMCIAQPTNVYFNHITAGDGLSQASNHFIYKDSRGFVWISSQDGLNRFDGRNIKIYNHDPNEKSSLLDNNIQSHFFEEDNGDIWFSTYEGVSCYVRKHNIFRHYFLKKENGEKVNGYHIAFKDKQNQLRIIVGGNKLYQFNPKDTLWIHLHDLPVNIHRAVPLFDEFGRVKYMTAYNIGQPGIHFFKYAEDNLVQHTLRFSGENGSQSINPLQILPEADSLLWIASANGLGRFLIDSDSKDIEMFPSYGYLYDVQHLNKSSLILAINNIGLKIIDKKLPSQVIAHYQHKPDNSHSLTTNKVEFVYVDSNGGIWSSILGIGVDFTTPQKVKFKTIEIGSLWYDSSTAIRAFALAEDKKGNIWCSTRSSGIYVFSPELDTLEHFFKDNPNGKTVPGNDVFYLFIDNQDRSWAFTYNGLGILHSGETKFQALADGNIFLHGVQLIDSTVLCASYYGGIFQAKDKNGEVILEKLPQVNDAVPFTILYQNQKGLLYACRGLTSIWVFNPEDDFSVEDQLPIRGQVNSFYEDPKGENLWIATSKGLVCFDQKNREIKYFTEADGLPNNFVYAICPGKTNELWMTTNRGIVRFDILASTFHAFDIPDGIQSLEFNTFSFLQRFNGELLFGGQKGINIFRPDSIRLLHQVPNVQITRLLVNDEEITLPSCAKTNSTNIGEIKKLIFPYQDNTLSFEFAALEFSNPSRNQFNYMMDGSDQDWVDSDTRGFARYSNLPSGRYMFKVKAANSDGVWSKSRDLEIFIQSPIWKRWWFLTFAFTLILVIGYLVYRWRVNQLLRLERLRNQISVDLHDDIGSALSNVNILTTLVREKLPSDSKALSLLARIVEEVQSSAESLDDIIWSINPQNDPLDRVFARMRRFASEIFEAKGIIGQLRFPSEVKHLHLDMEKRRQFYLLYKEAVNNLAKYADCKEAFISVENKGGYLEVIIRDNGKGFDLGSVKEGGNGLQNMRQRAKKLKANFDIQSVLGKGTTVRISFHITENRDIKGN
ncbi:MAG: hypothetical protein GY705_05840 [Bacteroidetes bacterium]|nr:hypothetical protein [Bacteroidota bacterium]